MQLIDTTGSDRNRDLITYNYKNNNGVLIIYDISKKESFEKINKYLDEVERYANEQTKICKILVGNKMDKKEREVSEEEGKKFANDNKMAFFEISAKDNINIQQLLNFIANKLLRYELNKII